MIEKEFIIENEAGLHARPAARLIKEASRFHRISVLFGAIKQEMQKACYPYWHWVFSKVPRLRCVSTVLTKLQPCIKSAS
jgi:hypothetical protein